METDNAEEIVLIGKLIATEEELQQVLLKKLNASYARKKELLAERIKITGNKDVDDYSDLAIPDLLEMIFRRYGKQHITQAAVLLESEFGRIADTQTISGALFRYVKQGKRFKKVGKNMFNLIDAKKGVQDMKNKNIN